MSVIVIHPLSHLSINHTTFIIMSVRDQAFNVRLLGGGVIEMLEDMMDKSKAGPFKFCRMVRCILMGKDEDKTIINRIVNGCS